jgi:hypothetical protein
LAYATVDELAEAVRTRVNDKTTPILERCLGAATEEIDDYLGAVPVPAPLIVVPPSELIHAECLARAVEWYKANDAALGVLGYNDSGTLKPPDSTFDRHAANLSMRVESWGIA